MPVWITPFSRCSIGHENRLLTGSTTDPSTAWGTNLQAVYVPFEADAPYTVRRIGWMNGATAAGNVDCGLFDAAGVKLLSSGSTAQGTINTIQVVDVTDTEFGPGRYFIGLALDDATGTIFANAITSALRGRWAGMFSEVLGAMPLPTTATPANYAPAFIPWFGLCQRDTA